jgi:GAF domain-containing protein
VNALGTSAGAPDRDSPDQARLGQLAEEQAALRRVATLVAQATPPGEVFAAVVEEVGRLLRVDLATLVRYEPGRMARPVRVWGPASGNLYVGFRFALEGHNISTLVFETGRPARIDRYGDSSSGSFAAFPREGASARRSGRRSSSRDACGG